MSVESGNAVRPLFFVAAYPQSGGTWLRAAIYMLIAMSQPTPPKQIELGEAERVIPSDAEGRFYEAVTGRAYKELDEYEVAAARTKVHALLSGDSLNLPIIATQSIQGEFHGNPTINHGLARGAVYAVRNPLDVAAEIVGYGLPPLSVIQMMMTPDRRAIPSPTSVLEPQGSWTQNVVSWTGSGQKDILVLRFEDLVAQPKVELARIAKHLSIPVTDKVLAGVEGLLQQIRNAELGGGDAPDFRQVLQPVHARAVIEAHAIEMDRHGYLTASVLHYAGLSRAEALAAAERHAPETLH